MAEVGNDPKPGADQRRVGAGRLATRIGAFVAIAIAADLVLGWAVSEAPVLAWVVGAAALALLGWALLRTLRGRRPWVGLGLMALSAVGGWAIAIGVDALIGAEAQLEAGDDVGGAEPLELAGGELGVVSAAAVTSSAIEPQPTTDEPPQTDPPAAGETPQFRSGGVTDLVVTAEGSNAVLTITPDDPDLLPAEIAVFSRLNPGRPITLAAANAWRPVGAGNTPASITWDGTVLRATIGAGARDAFAITVPDGTRFPDEGYAATDGSTAPGERSTATIERGFLGLSFETRAFVASLVGRQLTTGEYRLLNESTGAESVLSADRPLFSQTSATAVGGIYADGTATYRCDSEACTEDADLVLPIDAAAAIVGDPGSLSFTLVAPPDDGVTIACGEVTAAPPGLTLGTTCWGADGRPTSIERADTGDRFVLSASGDNADEARLTLPAEVSP